MGFGKRADYISRKAPPFTADPRADPPERNGKRSAIAIRSDARAASYDSTAPHEYQGRALAAALPHILTGRCTSDPLSQRLTSRPVRRSVQRRAASIATRCSSLTHRPKGRLRAALFRD